jgi:DNA-binding NtrC family response regulator
MSKAACVLVYGADSTLLKTRQMVLETIGGEVHATTRREDAERIIAGVRLRLLVLCYTLSLEDREAMLEAVRRASPWTKTLVLKADGPPKQARRTSTFSTAQPL